MSDSPERRISISPEPSDSEKVAIVAAVVAITANVQEDEASRPVDKWREAGKREALREQMGETRP